MSLLGLPGDLGGQLHTVAVHSVGLPFGPLSEIDLSSACICFAVEASHICIAVPSPFLSRICQSSANVLKLVCCLLQRCQACPASTWQPSWTMRTGLLIISGSYPADTAAASTETILQERRHEEFPQGVQAARGRCC